MKICKVIGNVWATKKEDSLEGTKLMVVEPLGKSGAPCGESYIAVDLVGAGFGERVLVISGSSARIAAGRGSGNAIDAAIVGIIDEIVTRE